MKKTLTILSAGLLALSALPAAAGEARQNHGAQQHQQDRDRNDRGDNDRNGRGDNNRNDSRYGRWQTNWGARPAGPPRSWTRTNDWYRHVRACQVRYRSYNPSTDRYVVRQGRTAVCRL